MSNFAVEQTGSHALAGAAHRGRWAPIHEPPLPIAGVKSSHTMFALEV